MIAVLGFFTGGIGRWLALAGILLFAVFMARMHWMQEGREEILKANVASATRIVTLQGKVTEKIVVRYRDRAAKTDVAAAETQKEVETYAAKNPAGMCIDDDFVRVLNGAAAGADTQATPGPADAVRPPPASPAKADSQRRAENGDGELRPAQQVRGQIRRPAGLEYAASSG